MAIDFKRCWTCSDCLSEQHRVRRPTPFRAPVGRGPRSSTACLPTGNQRTGRAERRGPIPIVWWCAEVYNLLSSDL
jgi:hypothetical protein